MEAWVFFIFMLAIFAGASSIIAAPFWVPEVWAICSGPLARRDPKHEIWRLIDKLLDSDPGRWLFTDGYASHACGASLWISSGISCLRLADQGTKPPPYYRRRIWRKIERLQNRAMAANVANKIIRHMEKRG